MLKVGITGGIGSGKSTVCRLFALMGIPVYDADSRAKALMTTNASLVKSVKKYFGADVYDKSGKLNRKLLGSRVFNDKEKLNLLNSLVHPVVQKDHELWHRKQKNCPFTIKEAALLFESGSYKKLDLIITVTSPLPLRIERAMKRDNTTRKEVMARLKKQWTDAQRKKAADFIISNNERDSLIQSVEVLYNIISYPYAR